MQFNAMGLVSNLMHIQNVLNIYSLVTSVDALHMNNIYQTEFQSTGILTKIQLSP